ncbi:MAG: hypothetical protein ACRDJE_14650 [Dehalococcoidia bacterium]
MLRWLVILVFGAGIGVAGTLAVQWWTADSSEPAAIAPAAAPGAPTVTVTLSYPLIAALIQRSIEQGETALPLTGIQASERNGRLAIRGTGSLLGQNVNGTVDLEPYVENGVLQMRIRETRLGPLPVPTNLDEIAEKPLNRELAATLDGLPATLTNAQVTPAGLTVTAAVRVNELRLTPR